MTGNSSSVVGALAEALANTAWNGKNNMPPFRDTLMPQQIRDIARYIADELFVAHPL